MSLLALLLAATVQLPNSGFDPGPNPMLLRHPTMNDHEIVFEFGDALWSVSKAGGDARRLTVGAGISSDPYFSPDGKWIAFSGNYDGNLDVYVMPAEGGIPKRLTTHPAPDEAVGWSPDGKSVLFASTMLSNTDAPRLFTVPVQGGFPSALPLPMGTMGSYSPDGKRLAYVPGFKWETAWKRYRGGQTYPIWIANLADSRVKVLPRENSNDQQPVWFHDRIYYLSDKTGPVGLYSYDTNNGSEREEIKGEGFDLKSVTGGPDGLVYEKLGSIWTYDPVTRLSARVPIQIHSDFLDVRPEFKNISRFIDSTSISPSGARVAVTARGWLMTVPAKKGDSRLLDGTQGLHRESPAWSPDAKTIAYVTDEKGTQQLALYDVVTGHRKLMDFGDSPTQYSDLTWSPDSKKIAYDDHRRQIWYIDLDSGKNTKVDEPHFNDPTRQLRARWSPDSKWLTWARDLDNHFHAIFLYNLDSGKKSRVTDGLADADGAVFDRNGKYLYFFASTEVGAGASWLDISNMNVVNRPANVYAIVLKKDDKNPLEPESDEETIAPTPDPTKAAATAKPAAVPGGKPEALKTVIDLDGIEDRIIALPVPSGLIGNLDAGPANTVFVMRQAPRINALRGGGLGTVEKFSFTDRKVTPYASAVLDMETTPDGAKALIHSVAGYQIASTMMPVPPGSPTVNMADLQVKIDPKVEWDAMYHEVWRNERLLFYSPTLNGINSVEMERRYEPFLKNIVSRNDLNYLFDDMLGELSVGHEFPGGGELPSQPRVVGGLLGADFNFDNHRYRISRVYTGERWNPGLYAPLAQPGVNAKVGEYVLAIDGKDLSEATDLYEELEGKAGKQVKIKLGPTANGQGSREVTVVPVAGEGALRAKGWEEDNRRYVQKMTNGRAGYVHVPDTGAGGWQAFQRYYYAQVGNDGMVVDERFNHGGLINDFMIREMLKPLDAAFQPRYGSPWPTPGSAIFGPKVMLINQFSGSGGDMFPWLFRREKVGPLIGKRTWGGLIAAAGFTLVDGGHINAPDYAFFDPVNNKWDVENWGVPPDQEVELDPYQWRNGHDSQLDAAIAEMNKRLAEYKRPVLVHPPYPDRTKLNVKF